MFVDAFEFYMFHFAYFVVNTKAFKGVSSPRRVWLQLQDKNLCHHNAHILLLLILSHVIAELE